MKLSARNKWLNRWLFNSNTRKTKCTVINFTLADCFSFNSPDARREVYSWLKGGAIKLLKTVFISQSKNLWEKLRGTWAMQLMSGLKADFSILSHLIFLYIKLILKRRNNEWLQIKIYLEHHLLNKRDDFL